MGFGYDFTNLQYYSPEAICHGTQNLPSWCWHKRGYRCPGFESNATQLVSASRTFNFGGYINSIHIPDRNDPSKSEDVLLGYKDFQGYVKDQSFINCIN